MKGIYKITLITENKHYIGSSVNVTKRMQMHKNNLVKHKCDSPRLQEAYDNNPDISLFSFEVLEILPDSCSKNQLLDREDYWMIKYDSRNPQNGFNWSKARYGGENHPRLSGENNPTYKRKHTTEESEKMKNAWDDERRKKLSERTKKYWDNYRKQKQK